MASAKGCLKNSTLGCLGLIGVGVIFGAIMALMAWQGLNKGGQVEQDMVPDAARTETVGLDPADLDPASLTLHHPGRVELELGQGEFQIHPAEPGAGLSARASFDSEVHEIFESYEILPDSSWVYRIRFEQTMPGLQALFRAIMGGDTDASIHIYLPPDVPIELAVQMAQGGGEVELGGLWLRTVDLDVKQGGFALSIDEPLREPVERMRLHARMGGIESERLGNASPRILDVSCGMGGGEMDLHGAWRNDCDARFSVKMGGINLEIPREMIIEGDRAPTGEMRRTDVEAPAYVLRLDLKESMGEIEIGR